jgi:hypothetical protein
MRVRRELWLKTREAACGGQGNVHGRALHAHSPLVDSPSTSLSYQTALRGGGLWTAVTVSARVDGAMVD